MAFNHGNGTNHEKALQKEFIACALLSHILAFSWYQFY